MPADRTVAEPDTIKVGHASSSKRPALTWRRDLRSKSTAQPVLEGHPRVWLLGDSVRRVGFGRLTTQMHAMLPSRGQGGNAALADAASALDEIVKLGKDGEPSDARVEAACTAYETEMIPRSFAWVKASENADIYLDRWGGWLAAKTFVGVLHVLCVFGLAVALTLAAGTLRMRWRRCALAPSTAPHLTRAAALGLGASIPSQSDAGSVRLCPVACTRLRRSRCSFGRPVDRSRSSRPSAAARSRRGTLRMLS